MNVKYFFVIQTQVIFLSATISSLFHALNIMKIWRKYSFVSEYICASNLNGTTPNRGRFGMEWILSINERIVSTKCRICRNCFKVQVIQIIARGLKPKISVIIESWLSWLIGDFEMSLIEVSFRWTENNKLKLRFSEPMTFIRQSTNP